MRRAHALLLVLGSIGCGTDNLPEWHEEGTHRWRELRVRGSAGEGFTRLSPGRTGISFINALGEEKALDNRFLAHGSGVALGDADGDGLVDVYLAGLDGPNGLYRNLGDWRFEEVSAQAGVTAPDRYSTGVAFADVEGDGDLDLLVTALGGPNALYLNDGTGRFTEQAEERGLASNRGSTTIAMADVNGDGHLDLYIANYKLATVRDLVPPQARAFDQVIRRRGDGFEVAAGFRKHYRESGIDPLGRLVRTERADPDWFYLNDGSGRFTAVPFTSGRFLDERGRAYREEPDYFALTARFHDVNGDGHPDLYVANDFSGPDLMWLNDGKGGFRAAPPLALRSTSHSSMAVDFSDINRDGLTDFFVVDMLAPRASRRRFTQTPTNTPLPKMVGDIDDRPQMQRNSLFLNRGDGTFEQIADLAGVEASEWSWATLFLDVDLDGYEDILVTTGHRWDVMDSDTHERLATTFPSVNWRRGLREFPALAVPNVSFRNRGDLTFEDTSERWGFGRVADVSHGMAAGDLDGDGDLDVIVNRLDSSAVVYRNDARAPRVAVRLAGVAPNTQGVGARIRVRGGPVPEQEKEATVGGMYLSSSELLYTFATGNADQVSIEVTWRSGKQTTVNSALPNRLYEIREPAAAGAPVTSPPGPPDPAPLFVDRSATLGHTHVDSPFDDFARQPLLPNRLSQFGPGVTWYDIDADGDDDLFITAGRGGELAYFRNERGTLRRVRTGTGRSPVDQTTVLGLPDGRGGSRLVVGQSNYEAASLAEALALPSAIYAAPAAVRPGNPRAAVPGDTSTVGALAMADVDGDGTLDLFVAGRMLPAGYPLPSSARLFHNVAGAFVPDSLNTSLLAGIGLVSSAVFSDVDGDGAPDLILAMEWGPIRVFMNRAGRLVEATESLGLGQYTSRWNGVATGDLDGDGRLDIVATSWGRNTESQPRPGEPLQLFYGDFDRSNTMDLILAQSDSRVGGLKPLMTRARLLTAVPALSTNVRTFAAYADATVETVVGPPFRSARRLEAATYDHMLFRNNGNGFTAAPLPVRAQVAPAFYAGVADFDGNGQEDVFLSQNFFPTEIESPRYDAGRGLLLLGDGAGALEPVPGQVSGIEVYGEQRGAAFADFDLDGRLDLVVSQNGAATRLFRNQGAKPGLVVRLSGPPQNPHAVGATLRVMYPDGRGPAREVQSGSGYWSQNGIARHVLGLRAEPSGVWIRWPGGDEQEIPLAPGTRDITVRRPS